jgi:hypothetical protein
MRTITVHSTDSRSFFVSLGIALALAFLGQEAAAQARAELQMQVTTEYNKDADFAVTGQAEVQVGADGIVNGAIQLPVPPAAIFSPAPPARGAGATPVVMDMIVGPAGSSAKSRAQKNGVLKPGAGFDIEYIYGRAAPPDPMFADVPVGGINADAIAEITDSPKQFTVPLGMPLIVDVGLNGFLSAQAVLGFYAGAFFTHEEVFSIAGDGQASIRFDLFVEADSPGIFDAIATIEDDSPFIEFSVTEMELEDLLDTIFLDMGNGIFETSGEQSLYSVAITPSGADLRVDNTTISWARVAAAPEPSSMAIFGIGVVAVYASLRRRGRRGKGEKGPG